MLKIPITLLLFCLLLNAESTMKCQAGKCGASQMPMSKKIPTKPFREAKHTVQQLFNVTTTKIKPISIAKQERYYGYVVADDAKKEDIYTRFSGYTIELFANRRYQQVQKGDPLAKLYSPEVYQAKQDYLHSLEYDKQTPSTQMVASARKKLYLLGVSDKEIKEIEKTYSVNEYTMLYAPQSGWIFEKNINQGSSFSKEKKLFEIINLQSVWVEVKVYQQQLKTLSTLEHFIVEPRGMNKKYSATKSLLYPSLNPKEATATLRLIVENPQELLKIGMYAKIYASNHSQTHLVIPRSATIHKNGKWYAFLATAFKGEYEPVVIDIEPLNRDYYKVLDGLENGDSVVNNALFMMDSDAQINGLY